MRVTFNSFTAGELSPKLLGRGDLPGAAKGCLRLWNFLPSVTGGVFRRPGTLYSWTANSNDEVSRLMPFNFSAGDSLLIELGDEVMRFGGRDGLVKVSDIPVTVATPWEEDELFSLRSRQINDVVIFAHPNHWPQRLTRITANTEWELVGLDEIFANQSPGDGFPWPPMRDENPTDITLTASATTGSITLNASGDIFESGHEGSFFQIVHRRDTAYSELFIPVYPAASATMGLTILPIDGQQFTIGGTVYTWKPEASLAGPYQVGIDDDGADVPAKLDLTAGNAIGAINGTPITGTVEYGAGTAPHEDVTASSVNVTSGSAAATGVLTGNGTNGVSSPEATPVNVVIRIGSIYYGLIGNPVDTLFNGATYNVRRGANEKATLQNLVKAINASGTNGNEYYGPSGVTANPSVTAALTADNQITVTAKTAGDAGNSIQTTINDSSNPVEPLTWGSATLTGGGASGAYRVVVTARETGTEGNSITVGGMYYAVLTSNNTNVSNNNTVTVGGVAYTFKTTLTPAPNEILIGADADASLLNLSRAINLTGTIGTDYGTGTVINPVVFAAATITADHQLVVVSKIVNPTANLAVSESAATLSWSATSLQSPWNTPTLTGGSDIDSVSQEFEVLGGYKIWSYGLWKGTVILERQRPEGSWEALRQWRGNNDRNIVEEGTAEYPQKLRLRLIDGSGTSSADVDRPRFVIEANDARIFGLVRIDSLDATNPETVANATVIRALFSTEPTSQWSEGSWSTLRGFPHGVTVHDQRLIFLGNSNQPQTIWSSATADFFNFRRGVNDSDGFSRTLAGEESSPIVWGVSLGAGLIIGKESEEWLGSSSDTGTAITPTNFQGKRQSRYGSADVEPAIVGTNLLFVKAGGRSVMVYAYAWGEQNFYAADITELSTHLTRGRIKQIAYSQKPDNILWIVTHDGKLLSLSYQREKEYIAMAYHPMSGTVESVAVVNGTDSIDDVYVAVLRDQGRFIERIDMQTVIELDADNIDEPEQRSLLTYLDSSVRRTGAFTTTCDGFNHLEGRTIAVQVDGTYHPPRLVEGGIIALDREASTVLGGISYADESVVVPFPISFNFNDGSTGGKKYKVSEMAAHFYVTSGARYANHLATPESELYPVKVEVGNNPVNSPTPVVNGIKRLPQLPRTEDDIRITMKALEAEPMNLLAVTATLNITG